MEATNQLILLEQFCTYHEVDTGFIISLKDYGLVTIVEQEHKQYVEEDELAKLEKMIRLHYEMDINIEGIEAITHLLNKMEQLQQRINKLERGRFS